MKAQYFKFSSKIMNSELNRAHLWIHVKNHDHDHHHHHHEHERKTLNSERNNSSSDRSKKKTAWIVLYQIIKENNAETPTLLHVSPEV